MASARKSVVFSTISNFGSLAVSLVLLVVVARWLYPEEIGAFAVAYSVIAVLESLRRFRLIDYVIQAPEVGPDTMRQVQGVGILASVAILAVAISGGLVMRVSYDEPLAGNLLLLMTITFPIKALTQPATAVLSREMRFDTISVVRITAALLKAVVTIGLLFMGLRAEALAFGIIAEAVPELYLLTKVQPRLALPLPSWSETRPLWQFCAKASGAQFLNRSSNSATDLFVGAFLGLAAAGLFNRANSLVKTIRSGIEQAIFPVAVAVFARSNRENREVARGAYLNAIALLTGFSWSALAVFIVLAEPLILTAYGDRWAAIIPASQVLALSGIIFAATALTQTLLASVGAVNALLKRELLIQVPRLIILMVTVHFDILAVAWGTVLAMAIAFFVNEQLVGRELGFGLRDLVRSLGPSAVVAGICCLVGLGAQNLPWTSSSAPWVHLVVALPAIGAAWAASACAFHPPLRAEILLILQKVFRKGRSSA